MAQGNAIVGVLKVLLTADTAEYESALRNANRAAKQWSNDLRNVGRQATDIGRTLTTALTLPILGMAAGAIKSASDFESSFAGIRKTVNDATDAMGNLTPVGAQLAQGMRDLALTIPVNVNELNRIGEAAGQLGIRSENILGFTEVMAELGVTTNLSSDQAASALARLANITQMPQDEFDRLGATVVGLGNNFATTESEIVDFGLRIAGAGKQAGLSEADILSIGTAMSSVGIEAEAGGTAVQKVLLKMVAASAEGGDAFETFAQTAGMSAQDFARMFEDDAAGAFTAFVEGLGRQGDQAIGTLEDLGLADQRLIRSFLSLSGAGNLLSESIRVGNQSWQENTALTKEAEQRFKTFESQLALFWAQVRNVGIELGGALLPIMRDLLTTAQPIIVAVGQIAHAFAAAPEPVRLTIVGIAGLLAAVGPMTWAFGQATTAAGTLVGAFKTKGIAMRALKASYAGVTAAGEAMTVMFGGVSLGSNGAALALARLRLAAASAWTALLGPVGLGAVGAVGLIAALHKLKEESGVSEETLQRLSRANFVYGKSFDEVAGRAKDSLPEVSSAFARLAASAVPLDERLMHMSGTIPPLVDRLRSGGQGGLVFGQGTDVAATSAAAFRQELTALHTEVAGVTGAQDEAIRVGMKLGKSNKELAEATGLSEAAVGIYREQLETADAKQKAWNESVRATTAALVPFKAGVEDAGVALQNVAQGFTDSGRLLSQSLSETADETEAARKETEAWAQKTGAVLMPALEDASEEIEGATQKTSTWRQNLRDLATSFSQMAQTSQGALGVVAGAIGRVITSINTAVDSFTTFRQGLTQGFSLDGLTNMASGILGMVGSVANLVRGWFGVSEEVKKARQEVQSFQQTLRDALTPQQRVEAAGRDWAATVIAVRDAYVATGRSAAEAEAIVRQLWDTDHPDRARAAIEQINAVLGEVNTQQEILNRAVEEYGFTVDELGPKFRAQQLSEQAQRLVEDYAVLIEAGFENGNVIARMSDKTNEYLHTALATNAEIPRSMEPMLQAMLEQGLLTDQNGEKLTSLEGLTWAETMTQGFDRVVGAVERLIETLTGIPRNIDIDINGHYNPPDNLPDGTGGGDTGFASGTMGRFGSWVANFGAGFNTSLHGNEVVATVGQLPRLFGDMLSSALGSLSVPSLPSVSVAGVPSFAMAGAGYDGSALLTGAGAAGGATFSDAGLRSDIQALRRDLTTVLPSMVESAARHGAQTAGRRR